MGFNRRCVGVHVGVESVFAVGAAYAFEAVVVALVQHGSDAFVVFTRQLEPQPVVFDPFAPQVQCIGLCYGPVLFVPRELVSLGFVKVKTLFQETAGVGKALGSSLGVEVEDGKGAA